MKSIEQPYWNDFTIGEEVLSFSKVYSKYSQSLYTYSVQITKDSDASLDIVDTLFMKASQVRPLHNSFTEFSQFLFKSCYNRSLNFLRSQKRRHMAHKEAIRQSDFVLGSIEEVLVKREEFGRAMKAVESLPMGLQLVVVHSFINGRSAKEIAVIMNVREATVHSQKWQALKRLRCSLMP